MRAKWFSRLLLPLARYLLAAVAGVLVAGIGALVYVLEDRPDLSVWHLADLDEGVHTLRIVGRNGSDPFPDLEDAVAPARKEEARSEVSRLLGRLDRRSDTDPEVLVRVNNDAGLDDEYMHATTFRPSRLHPRARSRS